MKKLGLLFAGTVAASSVGMSFVGAPSAGAAPAAEAAIVGPVRINPTDASVAWVTVRYVCQPGEEFQWLWVSAKQAEGGVADQALRAENSSQVSAAWVQSHPFGQFTCDGKWRTQPFEINTEADPVNGGGFGSLVAGQVWVQFCLMDGAGNFISTNRWADAR